ESDQRGRGELGKLGDGQLFGVVAYGRTRVEYLGALLLSELEQVGGVKVLHVERRVFAHQHGVEAVHRHVGGGAVAPPAGLVKVGAVDELDGLALDLDHTRVDIQVALQRNAERVASCDQRTHHCHGRVFIGLQGRQRVDNE